MSFWCWLDSEIHELIKVLLSMVLAFFLGWTSSWWQSSCSSSRLHVHIASRTKAEQVGFSPRDLYQVFFLISLVWTETLCPFLSQSLCPGICDTVTGLDVDHQPNEELMTGEMGLPREKSGHPRVLCGISCSWSTWAAWGEGRGCYLSENLGYSKEGGKGEMGVV